MMDFLRFLEHSSFSQWVVGSSSVLAFPTVLLFHTIGMGVVVGISAGFNLRILGLAPALPLAPFERFFPILWVGFWVNAVTGVILLVADATTKMTNPDFYIKMGLIPLAVITLQVMRKRIFRDPFIDKRPVAPNLKVLAIASLILWLGAITSGRLLAYIGPVSGLTK